MKSKLLIILLSLVIFVGCTQDENEVDTLSHTSGNVHQEGNEHLIEDTIETPNILKNGGLERWLMLTQHGYDCPENWLPHNNYNVRKNNCIVYEGSYSAKMGSRESGATSRVDQVVSVYPGQKIRIRFHYYIEQWKSKGARTYCYFRTRAAEESTIPAEELRLFYSTEEYYIFRGGGRGLTYFPHEMNVWQIFDETIEVPPNAYYFEFGINSYFGTTIYIDDCWIMDASIPH